MFVVLSNNMKNFILKKKTEKWKKAISFFDKILIRKRPLHFYDYYFHIFYKYY